MAGKSYIKVGSNNWDRIKKIYIKTGGQTWSAVRKSYVKTSTGWRKVFDTASNRPFISGNDMPKIRLNTFRTGSSYNPTGTLDDPVDPVVEAPPVQQMGPSWTSPTLGWPYESLGRHLWGYDGTWTSGNGTSMTFVYTWLYNLTGNSNDNTAELNATSTTGRTDMLTNLSSHLGQSDGDYFDKNFLTFRVTATNSAGNSSAESAPVYIVREVPTGSITMVSQGTAFTNYSMDATFTYSNDWYNKTNVSNSYIEWFAVNNIGDALTNNNRVEIQNLSSIAVTGTTSKSGTTSHVPTLANKYYYVKMTLNNSGTENAVIAITGFTPKSSVTAQSNKTALTSAPLTAPTISSITYNGSSVSINFSGGSGPYYELYHSNSPNAADGLLTNFYDAASTSSPLTESIVIAVGTTRYFWLRSSSVNRGNTTASGNAADGTFGPWASSGFAFTAPILDPQAFNTISFTKNFPSSGSGGIVRTTSLSWNASTNATRYEIEYEGSNNNVNWTNVQTFLQSSYTSSTSQSASWGSPQPVGGYGYYYFMRARVRASNTDSATTVIGDGGSYIYASGVAPGQPTFGTITTGSTTASIPVTAGTQGSNYLYSPAFEYQYRTSGGSYSGTWTSSSSPISLTGLSGGTYYIKIRTRNYDELVSPENETSFGIASNLTPPSIYLVTAGNSSGQPVTVYFTGGSGPYYQIWWTLGVGGTGYDEYGYSSPITDSTGPTSASTAWYAYVRSVSSLTNVGTGPSPTISEWSPGYQFTVTQAPITPTITMNANTNISTSGATINWSSTNQSYSTVNGTNIGFANSYTFSGLSSSTSYSGTVTVYSSTGNSASANYSFTTSAPAPVTPTITSGPFISWGSGNNYTLSASASNATNLEFQVQYSSSQTGSPSTGSATYFFSASSGGGTTGSQASNRNWARTRVRANNTTTGLSSAFTAYTAYA
jgi:hypothetical protein